MTENEKRDLQATMRRYRGFVKRFERYARNAENELLEQDDLPSEIRMGRMMRFYMYTGFVRGLKAGAEFVEGDDEAIQAYYEAMRGVDYSGIFRGPPELNGEVILN